MMLMFQMPRETEQHELHVCDYLVVFLFIRSILFCFVLFYCGNDLLNDAK